MASAICESCGDMCDWSRVAGTSARTMVPRGWGGGDAGFFVGQFKREMRPGVVSCQKERKGLGRNSE